MHHMVKNVHAKFRLIKLRDKNLLLAGIKKYQKNSCFLGSRNSHHINSNTYKN